MLAEHLGATVVTVLIVMTVLLSHLFYFQEVRPARREAFAWYAARQALLMHAVPGKYTVFAGNESWQVVLAPAQVVVYDTAGVIVIELQDA